MQQRRAFGPAYLPSAGLNERRATLHVFDHSAPLTIPSKAKGEPAQHGMAHYYRCTETGETRRWGFDLTFAKNGVN